MKTNHWIMFLFTMFIVLFSTFVWHIEKVDKQTDENIKAIQVLNEACRSALAVADIDETRVFAKEETRVAALDKFKASFNYGYGKAGYKKDDINYMVPCIILVDDDGFYINYSKLVNGGTVSEIVNTTSLKQNWTKIYGNYIVEYHLSNVVEITITSTGRVIKGTYTEAFEKAESPSALSFMGNEKDFNEEKNNVICSITEENVNYYITTHTLTNNDNRKYQFTMPVADDDRARLMDAPSVIAFVQSGQSSTSAGYINAYGFAGSILTDGIDFYEGIDSNGSKYYHLKNCENLTINENNNTPKTMDDCAADGYLPCPDCIR